MKWAERNVKKESLLSFLFIFIFIWHPLPFSLPFTYFHFIFCGFGFPAPAAKMFSRTQTKQLTRQDKNISNNTHLIVNHFVAPNTTSSNGRPHYGYGFYGGFWRGLEEISGHTFPFQKLCQDCFRFRFVWLALKKFKCEKGRFQI